MSKQQQQTIKQTEKTKTVETKSIYSQITGETKKNWLDVFNLGTSPYYQKVSLTYILVNVIIRYTQISLVQRLRHKRKLDIVHCRPTNHYYYFYCIWLAATASTTIAAAVPLLQLINAYNYFNFCSYSLVQKSASTRAGEVYKFSSDKFATNTKIKRAEYRGSRKHLQQKYFSIHLVQHVFTCLQMRVTRYSSRECAKQDLFHGLKSCTSWATLW